MSFFLFCSFLFTARLKFWFSKLINRVIARVPTLLQFSYGWFLQEFGYIKWVSKLSLPPCCPVYLWNPESKTLEFVIQHKESGIPLKIGVQNPSSPDKKSRIQYLESWIQSVNPDSKTGLLCRGEPWKGWKVDVYRQRASARARKSLFQTLYCTFQTQLIKSNNCISPSLLPL